MRVIVMRRSSVVCASSYELTELVVTFPQHVPKFLQQIAQKDSSITFQGTLNRPAHRRGPADDGDDDDPAARSPAFPPSRAAAAAAEERAGGREREDREDEQPQIANLEEFAGEVLDKRAGQLDEVLQAALKPSDSKESVADRMSTIHRLLSKDDHSLPASAAAADGGGSSLPSSSSATSTVPTSITSSRKRVDDPDADAEEKRTGRHVFRSSVSGRLAEAAASSSKKQRTTKKSDETRLSFQMQDDET